MDDGGSTVECPYSMFPTGRMITGKDHSDLMNQLLRVHLQPNSVEEIKRVRKNYNDLINTRYPITEADLVKLLKKD